MLKKIKKFDFSKLLQYTFELNDHNDISHTFTIVSINYGVTPVGLEKEHLTMFAVDFKETLKTSDGRREAMQVLNELKKGKVYYYNKFALVGFEFTITYDQEYLNVDFREGFKFHIINTQNFLPKILNKDFEIQDIFKTKNTFRFLLDLMKYTSVSPKELFSIKNPLRNWLGYAYQRLKGFVWGENDKRDFDKYFYDFVYDEQQKNDDEPCLT